MPQSLSSVRRLLALLAMGCVLPAASLALAFMVLDYQRERAQIARSTLATARALAALVDETASSRGATAPDAAQLLALLQRQQLPQGWIAAVFDHKGIVLARTRDQARFRGRPGSPELVRRMAQVPEDVIESVTLEGIPVVTAFSRAPSTDWSVAIAIPRAELEEPLRTHLAGAGAAVLALLGLSGALAWVLGSRISGSFQQTLAATESARADLQDKAQRLDAILDTAMDAIVSVDDDGRVLLFNSAAEELFRVPRAQAIGRTIEDFIPPALRAGHHGKMLAFANEERPARMMAAGRVVHAMRADGEVFPAEASISVAREGGQRLYTVILRDVTQRQHHVEALTRSNLDLQQFAFVASHDLRTPLRSMMGLLNLLLKRHGAALEPKARDLVDRALRAGEQMDHLTVDLLSYARLQKTERPLEAVDMNTALADAVGALDAAIKDSGAKIESQALPQVHGDRTQLVQLLQNLLGNAIKYCRGRTPCVRVDAERGDGEWVFHVRDNGIGIEPVHLERVFDLFHRLHTQQEFTGSGIGLAVCRRIVERHNGRIWCTSTPGEGSTFSFTLADKRITP